MSSFVSGLIFGLCTLVLGVIVGQLSVWKYLRDKGRVRIGEWIYEAYKPEHKTIYDN